MGDCFDSFTPFLINMQGTIMGYLLWIALQGFPGYEILNQIYPKRRNLPGAGIGLRVLIWLLGARKPRAVFQDEEMRKGKIDLHCSSQFHSCHRPDSCWGSYGCQIGMPPKELYLPQLYLP